MFLVILLLLLTSFSSSKKKMLGLTHNLDLFGMKPKEKKFTRFNNKRASYLWWKQRKTFILYGDDYY